MDTRYLMYHYTGNPMKEKVALAECIEAVLGRDEIYGRGTDSKTSVIYNTQNSNNKSCRADSTIYGWTSASLPKKCIPDSNSTILFVGYSTGGSLASLLKDPKRKTVTIDTKEYPCKCSVYSLKSMSGHAPYAQLIDDYANINCQKLILHHGSTLAKETLKVAMEQEYSKRCKTTRVIIANPSLKLTL